MNYIEQTLAKEIREANDRLKDYTKLLVAAVARDITDEIPKALREVKDWQTKLTLAINDLHAQF